MERLGIFIDGSFIYSASRRMGWNVDHRKTLEHFREGYALYNAFYYAPVTDITDERQRKFINALVFMGYTVRWREIHAEPRFDAIIATDLILTAPRWDIALLAAGVAGLSAPVEAVRSMGKEVWVLGLEESVDLELRSAADRFLDLRDFREALEREGGGKRVYPAPSEEELEEETGAEEEAPEVEGEF